MRHRIVTIILAVAITLSSLLLASAVSGLRLPGDQQGYEPQQPIAFSHRLHAGELSIQCLYCHAAAEQSRNAGIAAANVCMNCHRFVTSSLGAVRAEDELAKKEQRPPQRIIAPELKKLYDALGLDDKLTPDPRKPPQPLPWVRVHNLPGFVYFDHRAHVQVGVRCQECHGPVETMERMRQAESLSMGWCVNCHRDANQQGVNGRKVNASTDCVTCHY